MDILENMKIDFSEGVKAREESFGLLIVSKSTPALSLNHDGKFLWNLIDGNKTVGEMIALANKKYGCDCEKKVLELLKSFLDLKICYIKE